MEKLAKKQKILFITWGIIVVIVISLLTILGFLLNKKNKPYLELENKLQEKSEKYGSSNFIFNEDVKNIRITSEELIEEGFLDNLETNGDTCKGYVTVKFDTFYEFTPFIKCSKYQTKGYKEK